MAKLIVIIGVTGNQGGSVASTFLQDPAWRIRGLTRNTLSVGSKALSAQGVEMVQVDLHNSSSLKEAFKGANLVFSVTDFWKPLFDPENQARAKEQGKSIGQYAYELELEQGKNIVDAVAREVDGLDDVGFVASTLCSAKKLSNGKYQGLYHFDSKADVFPTYLQEKYPNLARKTSYLHTGYFFTSWRFMPGLWFAKVNHSIALLSLYSLTLIIATRWLDPDAIPHAPRRSNPASRSPQGYRSARARNAPTPSFFNAHGGECVAHLAPVD